MNELTLQDLLNKIQNTAHDFELEHGLQGLVTVSLETNRIIVEVKEAGHYTDARGILNESIYPQDMHLPIESTLTEREQDDIKRYRGKR